MFSFNPAQLGERVHALRRRRDQTLRELGRQADVNYVTLSKIERGKMPQVSADIVGRLANVLEVSVDYLLGLRDTPNLLDATPTAKEKPTPPRRTPKRKAKE
jgi:transcriptional regulator with XRE-family HTH domain